MGERLHEIGFGSFDSRDKPAVMVMIQGLATLDVFQKRLFGGVHLGFSGFDVFGGAQGVPPASNPADEILEDLNAGEARVKLVPSPFL